MIPRRRANRRDKYPLQPLPALLLRLLLSLPFQNPNHRITPRRRKHNHPHSSLPSSVPLPLPPVQTLS